MACTRATLVNMANKFIGYNSNNGTHKVIIDGYNTIKPLPRGYKVSYNDPWCATFVSFIAMKCNALDIIPAECSCGKMIVAASKMGIYIEKDEHHPSPGDIIFYDWQDNGKGDCVGYPDHTGIVCATTESSFTVIEGNKSNAVGKRDLAYNARYIRGFIAPNFTGTSVATDYDVEDTFLEAIAKFVIRGDYGTGEEITERLKRAGFDPVAVAAKVQELTGLAK